MHCPFTLSTSNHDPMAMNISIGYTIDHFMIISQKSQIDFTIFTFFTFHNYFLANSTDAIKIASLYNILMWQFKPSASTYFSAKQNHCKPSHLYLRYCGDILQWGKLRLRWKTRLNQASDARTLQINTGAPRIGSINQSCDCCHGTLFVIAHVRIAYNIIFIIHRCATEFWQQRQFCSWHGVGLWVVGERIVRNK